MRSTVSNPDKYMKSRRHHVIFTKVMQPWPMCVFGTCMQCEAPEPAGGHSTVAEETRVKDLGCTGTEVRMHATARHACPWQMKSGEVRGQWQQVVCITVQMP